MTLLRRLIKWLLSFMPGDEPTYYRETTTTPYAEPDWFAWECEQYRKAPCFWFDHWRYHGTPFAYHDPEEHELREVFEASRENAIRKYGRHEVNRMYKWACDQFVSDYDPFSQYARSPDPVEHVWQEYRKNCPH